MVNGGIPRRYPEQESERHARKDRAFPHGSDGITKISPKIFHEIARPYIAAGTGLIFRHALTPFRLCPQRMHVIQLRDGRLVASSSLAPPLRKFAVVIFKMLREILPWFRLRSRL